MDLKDTERHPFTIYFNASQDSTTRNTAGRADATSWDGGTFATTHTRTVTTNWTEVTTYTVIYQYETVTITEAADDAFDLHAIAGDPSNPSVNHNGTPNLSARTYTISSLAETGRTNFYTYKPLDTAIFTNWRKTAPVTVTKTVEGANAEDRDDTFDFSVTLADGEELNEAFLEAHPMPAGVTYGPARKIFTFSLKDMVANGAANGSMTLTLPLGAGYVVEEISPGAKYVATAPANASGTVPAAGVTVPFVNTRKGDLGIAINDLALEFNGALQHGYDITTVEGTGGDIEDDAYTVTGLRSGHVLTVQHHMAAQGTAVGSYSGHFENARITVARAADGQDVTGEYIVTTTPGSLTINPCSLVVTIVGNADSRPWNAEEQSVEGYTYKIVRKSNPEVQIADDDVHPVIEPAYSKAKGTDVGTYYMSLHDGSAVSFMKDDGYQIAPEDIHVTNGSLTITPRPVKVTADDKAKVAGMPDPAFTATVDGTLGGDTLNYGLTRAAGEAEGEYAIVPSGEAQQGNYTVTFYPGTLAIRELQFVQRATGSGLPVKVPVTEAMLGAFGFNAQDGLDPDTVDDFMNQVSPNGLRRWENLVTGTGTNTLVLGGGSGTSATQMTLGLFTAPGEAVDLGYTVLHELRKSNVDGGWSRVSGPVEGLNPSFNVNLLDQEGKSTGAAGFYRIVKLLVPNHDLSITNEIPATNIIGVLEVNSSCTNTMTAVPWSALAHDPAVVSNIVVRDYMKPAQLAAGDTLHAITDDGVYQKYTVSESGAWNAAEATVTETRTVATPPAGERDLSRGSSVWVTRKDPSRPFFLIGQYSGEDIEVSVAGSDGTTAVPTMITNPSFSPLAINDIDWGGKPSTSDVVWIPSEKGISTILRWAKDSSDGKMKWGVLVQNRATRTSYLKSDWTVPAGMGFWYNRKGAAFTVKLPVDKLSE